MDTGAVCAGASMAPQHEIRGAHQLTLGLVRDSSDVTAKFFGLFLRS